MLDDLAVHLRRDADRVEERQARALFDSAAHVLEDLKSSFERYEEHSG